MRTEYTIHRRGGSLWGFILIAVGLAFLGDNLNWFSFDVWEVLWPAVIIFVGLQLLFRRGSRVEYTATSGAGAQSSPPPPPPAASAGPTASFGDRTATIKGENVNETHVMGDVDLMVDSQQFRGGTVSTVFGSIRLDLSRAALAEGEQVLALNTVFGEVKVFLPPGWEYTIEATTVFGEVVAAGVKRGGVFSNVVTTTQDFGAAGRRLRIHASTVFGEVQVVTR